jgi:hypothetical protein
MMRMLAQLLTEKYSQHGVHVANVVIDGSIDSPGTRALPMAQKRPESVMNPSNLTQKSTGEKFDRRKCQVVQRKNCQKFAARWKEIETVGRWMMPGLPKRVWRPKVSRTIAARNIEWNL